MTNNFTLDRSKTGLLIIDIQERLFPYVDHACEIYKKIQIMVQGSLLLNIPIFVTEQYPEGLGPTIEGIKASLNINQKYFSKTSFSCLKDEAIRNIILSESIDQWILIGIEAHVCVLQSAKDLISIGKRVAVLNDAISSRSIYDFSTAIAEMRDAGVRVTSTETVLFELMQNSKIPEFKAVSALIKPTCCSCS